MPYLINGFDIENDLSTTQSSPTTIADNGVSRAKYQGLAITYSPSNCTIINSLTTRYNCYGVYSAPKYLLPTGTITDGLFGLAIRYNHTGLTPNTNSTLLITSQTITSPANCNQILIYSVGGGGGGGDTGANSPGGTGGNSGPGYNGEVAVGVLTVGPNSNFIVVVGAGGGGGNRPGGITAARGAPSYVRFPTAGTSPTTAEATGGMGCPNAGDGTGIAGSGSNGSPSSTAEFYPTANFPGSYTAQQVTNPSNFTYTWPPTGQITNPAALGILDSPSSAIGGFGAGTTNTGAPNVGTAGNHGMVAIFFKNDY